MGVPLLQHRLIFAGRQLNDEDTVEDSGLDCDSTVLLVLRLLHTGDTDESEEEEEVYYKLASSCMRCHQI